ncbi:MAG TPA: non-homologous end-joining DNA ligase [Candidatus Thermoplasmatota archaeon]|nr:non-homologous end-joining DNA ligase [Candidatus Thermoplasmatota archaeon]
MARLMPKAVATSVPPMLASPGTLPVGKGWAVEFKWDGIRAMAHWDGRTLHVFSRNGRDVTPVFPELRPLGDRLGGRSAILDGEIVALDAKGRPRFGLLQSRLGRIGEARIRAASQDVPVTYVIFDLLHLGGEDLTGLPYLERRKRLMGLKLKGSAWSAPAHHTDAASVLEASQSMGLEGVVAKRLDSPYVPGKRTDTWVKVRNRMRQEFVIGGWSEGEGSRSGTIGSLLLGHYGSKEDPKRLVYVGRVGSGLGGTTLVQLVAALRDLDGPDPFDSTADDEKRHGVHFVKPRLVCEVEFSELTHEGRLRQGAFKGMRKDKPPRQVVWEQVEDPRTEPGFSPKATRHRWRRRKG